MGVDLNRPQTWTFYKKHLCKNCMAFCCSLPVEATAQDLVRMQLLTPFDLDLGERHLAKFFKDKKIVRSYNKKSEKFTLAQRPNNDCVYLNEDRRCSIYDSRPETCRNHPKVGPRPNHCPFQKKEVTALTSGHLRPFVRRENSASALFSPAAWINLT